MYKEAICILGSSGGLAKGVLSLLNKSIVDPNSPIYKFLIDCQIHLIDNKQKEFSYFEGNFPHLKEQIALYEYDLQDTERFKEDLINFKISLVIDVSWADTVEMLGCCNELGIIYINSALENRMVDEDPDYWGVGTSARNEIFEDEKPYFQNTTAIIGSGMNPGVVQWMAIELIKKGNEIPKACYIVEHDTSFFKDESLSNTDTIYATWSPECFLDETIDSFPLFVKNNIQFLMYNEVYEQEFKVSLGDKNFYGYLVPHEEVISLGNLYKFESGFIYRVNEHTTNLIKDNIDNLEVLWNRPMELLDPSKYDLMGEDLVGVLLVYENKEIYMYNVSNNEKVYRGATRCSMKSAA
ncbi:MAG: S-adenosylmethionine decarboxylase related protein [Bacillaceae bacterium]